MWHRCYGHFGVSILQKLANKNLVDCFDFDLLKELTYCEACPQGMTPKKVVRCGGKMNEKSLGDIVYFLTFIDDKTQSVWVYNPQCKDQVFKKLCK